MGDVTTMLVSGVPVLGLVVGLTGLVKNTKTVPDRFLPLVALALALAFTLMAWGAQIWPPIKGLGDAIVTAVAIGLASMGLYSGGRTIKEG